MGLRPYQEVGVDFLRTTKRAILADEMGVGKTPQLIRAAAGRTLVVAPPPLHLNWEREIEQWAYTHVVDLGSKLGRQKHQPPTFEVTSYHSLVDMTAKDGHGHVAGKVKPQWRGPWDTVICDEAHHIKGRNTGYAKAVVKLAAESPRVYLATGTPIRNWAHEVFMLCRALHPGDKRFSSFWRWADRWFTVHDETRWQGKRKIEHKVIGGLRGITTWERFAYDNGLTHRWLRRELDDPEVGLNLPEMQHIQIPVVMGRDQRKAYLDMEKTFLTTYEGETISGVEGGQWAHLMRLATGLRFHPDIGKGPSAKLTVLADLMQPGSGPWVLFAWHRHTVDVLVDWCNKQGFKSAGVYGPMTQKARNERIDAFKAGDLDVIVGSYPTMGEGHTLTRANKMVLFETSAVPAHIDQAKARIRRFGQNSGTTVWTLVTSDTVEDFFVNRVLPAKRDEANAVNLAASDIKEYREWAGR